MDMVTVPLLLLLLLAPLAVAQWQNCANNGNYRPNSTYQANLRLLSSILPNKAASNTTLFATGIVGNVPDIVYALTLCRGDFNGSDCESCVATAFQDLQQLCAYNKDAAVYYDPCMLRISNRNFLANATDNDPLILMSTQNITVDADSFRIALFTLLNSTTQWTAISLRRFTTSSSGDQESYARVDASYRLPAAAATSCWSATPGGPNDRPTTSRTQLTHEGALDYCCGGSIIFNTFVLYLFRCMDEKTKKRKGKLKRSGCHE